MAAIPLNRFRSYTHTVTVNAVGIYTCPPGVASLVIYGNVANVGTMSSVTQFSVFHSRNSVDTPIVVLPIEATEVSIPSTFLSRLYENVLIL